MYKLSSSDVTNNDMILALNNNLESAEKIRSSANLNKIQYMIFSDDITKESIYKTALASLTLADELVIPLKKKIIDILYFSLCVNSDTTINFNIKNLIQANTLFELYENDYKKVEPEDNKKSIRFTTLQGYHPVFFPGYSITWKIPVSFFKADGKNYTTLSGLNYCVVIVNDVEYKIPRLTYQKFFRESMIKGRLVCESTDEIKDKFDLSNNEALENILTYIGYLRKKEFQDMPLPSLHVFVQENKIISTPKAGEIIKENNDSNLYWTNLSGNRYVLLPKLNYIPLINKDFSLISLLCEQ